MEWLSVNPSKNRVSDATVNLFEDDMIKSGDRIVYYIISLFPNMQNQSLNYKLL